MLSKPDSADQLSPSQEEGDSHAQLGSAVEPRSAQIRRHLLQTLRLDVRRGRPVQLRRLAHDPDRSFERVGHLSRLLQKRVEDVRNLKERDVVDTKVVSETRLGHTERRHSDTRDEHEHVEAFERGGDLLA